MERKLASIQEVIAIEPIPNADAIELVRINGWQCVTKKNEFRPGDLGVYFEIDAIPPDDERFRFLWTPKSAQPGDEPTPRPEKFRIRTLRLRGALSQGLFMPLSLFPEIGTTATEGEDVTALLQVGKYEPPAPTGMGDWRGPFPAMVPKTDEMRVQSVPAVLEELAGKPYAITLKYDGTSATFAIDPRTGEFHAASRNQSIKDGSNLYWNMARKYDLEAILQAHPNYALQGEIVGPGVQKNPLGLSEVQLFIFNVYDMTQAKRLDYAAMRAFLEPVNLSVVETLERGESFAYSQEELLRLAEGKYARTKNEREGIVIRPQAEVYSSTLGGPLSFKAISNRYLLAED
jgi:RNA ligase (TIGR02306 family)